MYSSRYFCAILMKLVFSRQIFIQNIQTTNFMKIRLVGAELFRAERQTNGHDEANNRISQFFERV